MSLSYILRQVRCLARVLVENLGTDPVFFLMQLSRRLPPQASTRTGAALGHLRGVCAKAASRWLVGDRIAAETAVLEGMGLAEDRKLGVVSAKILGEIALNLGMVKTAEVYATIAGQRLTARIAWHRGDVSGAWQAAGTRSGQRYAAEREVFAPRWRPPTPTLAQSSRICRSNIPQADIAFFLTNSLPHTQSGYTLRSHAILRALRELGVSSIAATRVGYPISIGRMTRRPVEIVDDISYLRDIPVRPGKLLSERIAKQAEFISAVAVCSGASVLHTTTHFPNALATRAAAEVLGLPWVYEVRGALEETWVASRGSLEEQAIARESERFQTFRAREIEVARDADLIVTLGTTMADELVSRGVSRNRIMVAPNAVSATVLAARVDRAPAAVRESNGLPRDGIWVGTAASLVAYEGLDTLIDAVVMARSSGVDLRLLIIGTGVELPRLRQQAAELGTHAIFTGRVPQARAHELIQCLDIFVVPRRRTPVCELVTPIKPIEAAGLQRTVVVSDLPALTEALPDGGFAIAEAENAAAWAEILTVLADDPSRRREIARRGRGFVVQARTWNLLGESYVRAYRTMGVLA